jgi:hypothetical protein
MARLAAGASPLVLPTPAPCAAAQTGPGIATTHGMSTSLKGPSLSWARVASFAEPA